MHSSSLLWTVLAALLLTAGDCSAVPTGNETTNITDVELPTIEFPPASGDSGLTSNETASSTYFETTVPDTTTAPASQDSRGGSEVDGCTGSSSELRHWATLELRGVPVFLHQRLDRKGHFLIEPLMSLPDKAATLNASCVRLDRLTGRHYVSFPVTLQDNEVLFQVKEKLKHVAPKSVAFMKFVSSEMVLEQLPGGWWLESFMINSWGRLGYLRVNCPDHASCVELRAQLTRHDTSIFERILFQINASSDDGCVSLANLTKQLTVPDASQMDVSDFSRTKRPHNCSERAAPEFFREFHVNGHPAFVLREGSDFWLEPLLTFDGAATVFRNASGWPGLSLRLQLREPTVRSDVADRLRLLGNGTLRFLHLVDYRMTRTGFQGFEVERLRVSVDRATANLRLMAPNATLAEAAVMEELSRRISADPTLLFDALRFNFSFSPDDACGTAYWTERRIATPRVTQFRVQELQRRHVSRPRCLLAKQPQLEKVLTNRGMPVPLWRRLDRPLSSGRHFLIEPLMFFDDQLSLEFDYTRNAHFVSLNVTLQSPQVVEEAKRNLTYLPARSVAFMHIRELQLNQPLPNVSGVSSFEFYMTHDQREGFLRLYCENRTVCEGIRNYLKSSELLLERLHWNLTLATPDDGCVAPEPIPKLIAAPTHKFELPYLREMSPSQFDCDNTAYPQVQAALQPLGSCQLVALRSPNAASGNRKSLFLEPAFCFLGAECHFDFVDGRSFLKLRLSLTNESLIPGLRQALDAADGDTLEFMELSSLRVSPGTRLPGLEAGAFKVSFDRREAELRVYCGSAENCSNLQTYLQDNNTVLLENFNLDITASLPSFNCRMSRPLRKQIGNPNTTYFDLNYLNSKTHQLPGCPKELSITLFAQKVIDGCPTFVYKREDAKAGFYVEPQFCFNGRVHYGYNYLTSSHYVSFGVDLNRPSTLAAVASQLVDLAPKRVAFLELRKVTNLSLNLINSSRPHPSYLLDGFHITVDRSQGEFRVLCANAKACKQLGANVSARPWILFERIQLESLMANGCELSNSTHQQPSSPTFPPSGLNFHLPLSFLRHKFPRVDECKQADAPRLFQILSVDGCPVSIYRLPPPEKSTDAAETHDLVIEPLLCFHGNAYNATVRSHDYLAGEDYVSIRLLLQSHEMLKAVQEQLSLTAISGSLRFAQLWDLTVTEKMSFDSLRVTRVGVSADRMSAELRVACRGAMCDALRQTLVEEPADYLKSIQMSAVSLLPSGRCHFKAPVFKRPIVIGYSRSSQCAYDSLPTTTTTTTTTMSPRTKLELWMRRNCNSMGWSNCNLNSEGTAAYFFSRGTNNWHSARSVCQRLSGDLTTISDGTENELVSRHLLGSTWIGMYREQTYSNYYGHQSRFRWVGSHDSGFRNFRSDHSGSNYDSFYDCVAMMYGAPHPYYVSGLWEKTSCHNSKHYVCKVGRQVIG